jgi:hypothetical protein
MISFLLLKDWLELKAQNLPFDNMLYIAQNKLKDKVLQFARKARILEIDSYIMILKEHLLKDLR